MIIDTSAPSRESILRFYCLDCELIGKTSAYCEHCSSMTVWPLSRWLNREEKEAIRA